MNRVRLSTMLCIAWSSVACGPKPLVSERATPAPPVEARDPGSEDPGYLGTFTGSTLTEKDLDPEIRAELVDLENELEQRRMHLRWVGFEKAVNDRLLAAEASKRRVSVDELRESVAAAVEVTDDEVREIYEANKAAIPVSLEEATPTIREQLESQKRENAVRAFVEELRQGANVNFQAAVPELPRYSIESSDQPALGAEEARVTIVEFSDFECPYCNEAREVLAEVRKSYGDRVRLIYRDLPLSQHPNARTAAAAAHCALEQGRFWEYHDTLFDNSNALNASELRSYAETLKLDLDTFDACLASDRPEAAITADETAAKRLGVRGTPAIFINGVKLIGLLPLPLMKSLIDHELEQS